MSDSIFPMIIGGLVFVVVGAILKLADNSILTAIVGTMAILTIIGCLATSGDVETHDQRGKEA